MFRDQVFKHKKSRDTIFLLFQARMQANLGSYRWDDFILIIVVGTSSLYSRVRMSILP
jgi:hypothetical protein